MALLPTVLAIGIGIALGVHWGGALTNLTDWRPPAAPLLLGGVGVLVLIDLVGVRGGLATFIGLVAGGAVLAFAVLNVRVGGMVLVVVGVGMNLLVTLVNWGRPVSASALVSAGIVSESDVADVQLSGARSLSDGAVLGFLGDVIPLPWGHVISIGDILTLIGLTLVTASVTRRFEVGGGHSSFSGGRFPSRGGPTDYRNALNALGRGPAPRRGPGLHPSRLRGRPAGRRPRPGTRPR